MSPSDALPRFGARPFWFSGAPLDEEVYSESLTMFNLGDLDFSDPQHHGLPEFRALKVRQGYVAASKLGLEYAFREGASWAMLKL
jgi:hypothetical protein